jgi:protein O-mannosyl-transferase
MRVSERHDSLRQLLRVSGLRLAEFFERDWPRCILLASLGFAVHLPALQGELVWDDQYLARDNPFIKSPLLILEAFRHYLFLDSFSAHYRPVQNISFILDYTIWNTNPYGFHLTNVLLHIASGVLLYFLLRKLLLPWWRSSPKGEIIASLSSFLIALLWIVHPVHSAAIDYISGRADSLAFFFACGGWLLVFLAREIHSGFWRTVCYAVALACGLFALCSREIACVWFALFLVHIFLFDKQIGRRSKLVSLGCCLFLLGIYAGLRQLPEQRPNPNPSYGWSRPTRAALMLRALGDYGRLMVFPSNLHMERTVLDPNNYLTKESWRSSVAAEYLSILGLIVAVALLHGSSRKGAGQSARIFGAAWFFLGYFPVSNFFELNATSAEHWLYLPSVGFLIFLAGCAVDLPPAHRKVVAGLSFIAVVGFSVRTAVRSTDWVTPETFYRQTIAAGGMSTRVGVNLAQIYANKGEYLRAEPIYRRVLAMTPDYPIARTNLAEVLYRQGKKSEAEAMFLSASTAAAETRKEYPRTWIAALNLAQLRHQEKDDQRALVILEKARADYPHTWEIISLEAEILRETKGPHAALNLVESFAQQNWWHCNASIALGRLYAEEGDLDCANAALHHASWLDVHDVNALNLIATLSVRQNQLEEACRVQRRAVARQPDEPRQYAILSNILEKMGRTNEARAAIAEVSRLQALVQTHSAVN